MNEESDGPPPEDSAEDLEELRRLRRLIVEAQARGEDPRPLVKRAVRSTIAALRSRLPAPPNDDT